MLNPMLISHNVLASHTNHPPYFRQASFMFICQYLDYFGEPAVVMVLACGNMLCGLIVWIFGVYGRAAGLLAVFCCFYSVQQAMLTFFYVSAFKNPLGYHPESRFKAAVDQFLGKEVWAFYARARACFPSIVQVGWQGFAARAYTHSLSSLISPSV